MSDLTRMPTKMMVDIMEMLMQVQVLIRIWTKMAGINGEDGNRGPETEDEELLNTC
jgi:hypothetical protein